MTEKVDLGMGDVEIGTKEEALWTKVVEACEARIAQFEESLIVERAFLQTAKKKLKEAS